MPRTNATMNNTTGIPSIHWRGPEVVNVSAYRCGAARGCRHVEYVLNGPHDHAYKDRDERLDIAAPKLKPGEQRGHGPYLGSVQEVRDMVRRDKWSSGIYDVDRIDLADRWSIDLPRLMRERPAEERDAASALIDRYRNMTGALLRCVNNLHREQEACRPRWQINGVILGSLPRVPVIEMMPRLVARAADMIDGCYDSPLRDPETDGEIESIPDPYASRMVSEIYAMKRQLSLSGGMRATIDEIAAYMGISS